MEVQHVVSKNCRKASFFCRRLVMEHEFGTESLETMDGIGDTMVERPLDLGACLGRLAYDQKSAERTEDAHCQQGR
jgi:hypothetical protein